MGIIFCTSFYVVYIKVLLWLGLPLLLKLIYSYPFIVIEQCKTKLKNSNKQKTYIVYNL